MIIPANCLGVLLLLPVALGVLVDTSSIRGGLVSMVRSIDDSIILNNGEECTFDGGAITFGGPLSLQEDDKYYYSSSRLLMGYTLVMDAINRDMCGVELGGKRYKLELKTYDDQSSKDVTYAIGERLVRDDLSETETKTTTNGNNETITTVVVGGDDDDDVDIIIAGYSSFLTEPLAEAVAAHNAATKSTTDKKVMMAGVSAVTKFFANRTNIFTATPPTSTWLRPAIDALAQKTNAKTIAVFWEDTSFSTEACAGVPGLLQEQLGSGLKIVKKELVPVVNDASELEVMAEDLKELNPDVVISCIYDCQHWIKAMRSAHWSPRAQAFTGCVTRDKAVEDVGTDMQYIIGPSSWDRTVYAKDAVTGWTSEEFSERFSKLASEPNIAWSSAAAGAMISIFVQTLQGVYGASTAPSVKPLDAALISDYLSRHTFPTMFGDISFDENGQNANPSILLQRDGGMNVQTTFPDDKASGEFVYPMPTWDGRDCIHQSDCSKRFTCSYDGYCECPEGEEWQSAGMGATATCQFTPASQSSTESVKLAVGILAGALVIIALLVWRIHAERERKADALWKIKNSELKFDDEPVDVGRGNFGVVYLAEYKGTEVAVKRAFPPRENTRDKNNGSHGAGLYMSDGSSGSTASIGSAEGMKSSIKMMAMSSGSRKKLEKDFIREMRQLSKLRHPCIIQVMGAVTCKGQDPLLVMEYMQKGSLYNILHNMTVLEGEILHGIMRDISQGMRFLHATGVVHGDLKSSNVLVDANFKAKVADLGLCRKKGAVSGTPYWMSPELLRGDTMNTTASDVYAYGIVLYEVYSRRDPYEGEVYDEVLKLVQDPETNKRPPVPRNCPPLVEGLMTDCLVADAQERPSFEEIDGRLKRMDISKVETEELRTTVSLDDIFPAHIAKALAEGREVESEHKDSVTIFFSDIVGFTEISSTIEPKKVASMLDRLYTKFDQLSFDEDIFKVETIGDAYMAVTNLVKDQPDDHAARIARFAGKAIAAAKSTLIDQDDPGRGYVNIRVGFHSGSVVADVVGTRNPRYCLFGDTVNTASRMESSSKVNMIHCSKQAADLLKEQDPTIVLKSRGLVPIKGKGEMKTYWVFPRTHKAGVLPDSVHTTSEAILPDSVHSTTKDIRPDSVHNTKDALQLAEEGRLLRAPTPDNRRRRLLPKQQVEC